MGFHNQEKAREAYDKDLEMVKAFAHDVGLSLLCMECNVMQWYNNLFSFGQCAVMINMSLVLALQKLFRKYYFASTYPVWEFKYDHAIMEYYETLLLPMLSTQTTELIVANPDMTRVDKEKLVLGNPLVEKYLYVCWKEIRANEHPDSIYARIKDNYRNCTRCDKCLRTLLAIDLLGHLKEYREIFDVDYYLTVKDQYIAKVIAGRKINPFHRELYDLLQESHYQIDISVRMRACVEQLGNNMRWLARSKTLRKIYHQIIWRQK